MPSGSRAVALLAATSWMVMFGLAACPGDSRKTEIPPPAETQIAGRTLRDSKIPADAVKVRPETDAYPPVLHLEGWQQPVGLGPPVDTAGAEDSPFITPDGGTLYFWFTPSTSVPAKKQLLDEVTGIYVSRRQGNTWSIPPFSRICPTRGGSISMTPSPRG